MSMWRKPGGLTAMGGGLIAVACLAASVSWAADEPEAPPQSVEQIEQIVRDYLLREPEIVYQALEELQRKQAAEKVEQQKLALMRNQDQLLADPADPVVGNPAGEVTLVEFFDYRCPYCQKVVAAMQELIKEDQGLRVVFKELPVLGEDSVRAAHASLASQKQDKSRYLDFHVALMSSSDLSLEGIKAVATQVGLDAETLLRDMNDPEIGKAIEVNYALAQSLGIEGTPAFVVGDQLIPGAVGKDRLAQLIDQTRTSTN